VKRILRRFLIGLSPDRRKADREFPADVYAGYATEADEVVRVRQFEHFNPAPLPSTVPRGRAGRCSVNALGVAATHGLQLVRGYAIGPNSNWVGHWWVVTPDDAVCEVTWEAPGQAYIGERIDWKVVGVDDQGKPSWSAFTRAGLLIEDLGVYVVAPTAVEEELHAKHIAWMRKRGLT
jgi:hypothetical protein